MKKILALLAGCALFALCALGQQTRPAFTGNWVLDPHASKFGSGSARSVDAYKIKQTGEKLEVLHLFNGDRQLFQFVLDSKERTCSIDTRGSAHWDGDNIEISRRQQVPGGIAAWNSRYTLSPDGKTLTMQHHVLRSPLGPAFDEELVYRRQ